MNNLDNYLKNKEQFNNNKNNDNAIDLYNIVLKLADELAGDKKYKDAIKYLEEVSILFDDSKESLSLYLGDLNLKMADCYYELDNICDAIESIKVSIEYYKIYKKNNESTFSNIKLITAYGKLSRIYENDDELKKAIDALNTSLSYAMQNLDLEHNSFHYFRLGEIYEAIADDYRELDEANSEHEFFSNSMSAIDSFKYAIDVEGEAYARIAFIYTELASFFENKMMLDPDSSMTKRVLDFYKRAEENWDLFMLQGDDDTYDNLRTQFHIYKGLSEVYELLNDDHMALEYYIKLFFVAKRRISNIGKYDYENVVYEFGFSLYRICELYNNKYDYEFVLRYNEIAFEYKKYFTENIDNFWPYQAALLYKAKALYFYKDYNGVIKTSFEALGNENEPIGRAANIGALYSIIADSYNALGIEGEYKKYLKLAYDKLLNIKATNKKASKDFSYAAIKLYDYDQDDNYLSNALGRAYDVDNDFYEKIEGMIMVKFRINSNKITELLLNYWRNKK